MSTFIETKSATKTRKVSVQISTDKRVKSRASLTAEQCTIPFSRLVDQKGFTDSDLAVHEQLFVKATRPKFFDNVFLNDTFGLKYIDTRLINFDDVDTNDKHGQGVRSEVNRGLDGLTKSINEVGFKLDGLLPCAYKLNDKWVILDGRTRISIMRDALKGGKLLINLYEKIDTTKSDDSFAIYCNTEHSYAGHATDKDMYGYVERLIINGYFKFDTSLPQEIAGSDFKEAIDLYLKNTHGGSIKLSSPQKQKLLHKAMSQAKVISQIIPIGSTKELTDRVTNVLGLYDSPKYKYVIIGSDEWDIFKIAIPKLLEIMADSNNKQIIRLVVCKQKPTSVSDWYLANIRVGLKMAKHLKDAAELFGGGFTKNKRLEIYGTVPLCHTEIGRFPLDKVIKYSSITLADYNKFGDKISQQEFKDLKDAL